MSFYNIYFLQNIITEVEFFSSSERGQSCTDDLICKWKAKNDPTRCLVYYLGHLPRYWQQTGNGSEKFSFQSRHVGYYCTLIAKNNKRDAFLSRCVAVCLYISI